MQPDKGSDETTGGANAAAPEQKFRANFQEAKDSSSKGISGRETLP
ncbi:hypothetical protein SynWH8101_1230 [Synechococcus sp. WH 8101]|nr:hypothetical protein SynWH8101_1230 [Synechococcus sp. WH 8101]QNI45042.1 hypothetical protein SynRCC2555_01259 [Synechococcus sp. WH 8101]